jgi:hypothetical protein
MFINVSIFELIFILIFKLAILFIHNIAINVWRTLTSTLLLKKIAVFIFIINKLINELIAVNNDINIGPRCRFYDSPIRPESFFHQFLS